MSPILKNSRLIKVHYSDVCDCPKFRSPLYSWVYSNHLNTGLVWYSDGYCTYQLGSSNSTLNGFVWSCVTVKISATIWVECGGVSETGFSDSVDSSELTRSFWRPARISSSFFLRRKIFSAEVLGHERTPFLSVQHKALKQQVKINEISHSSAKAWSEQSFLSFSFFK